jgi:hypothetical protein
VKVRTRLPLPRTHERPCLCLPLPMRQRCDSYCSGRKRKALGSSLPIRRSSRLSSEQSAPGSGKGAQPELDTQSDQIIGQPPPPSPLAASQRPYRIQLQVSTAKRNLHGAGPPTCYWLAVLSVDIYRFSAVYWRTLFCHWAGPRDQIIFFDSETKDRLSTKDWKAVSAALDRNQPTTKFSNGNPNY